MQVIELLDRHAEALHEGGRDLLGAVTQLPARGGQRDGEAAFVGEVAIPAEVADRFEALEQR